MDGQRGKLSAMIMGPFPGGIKRFKPMTNNKHDKLTFDSISSELTLEAIT
jgi:hypothetical protein